MDGTILSITRQIHRDQNRHAVRSAEGIHDAKIGEDKFGRLEQSNHQLVGGLS
jgi:hypothetical protein